jgi:chorismate lyase/3-hydroxybenzoate synthase
MPKDTATIQPLRTCYEVPSAQGAFDDDVLVAVTYGSQAPMPDDARCLRIDLEPLAGNACVEVWRGVGTVRVGTVGHVRYAEDGEHCAGWLSIEENAAGNLADATEAAYSSVLRFHAESPYRHVWRMWNYVADINAGRGDEERYRQFCLGRARAFAKKLTDSPAIGYPAASAVGKRNSARTLEVCWVSSRSPGFTVENPRQVSAYAYPREYGPASPTFSRATVTSERLLLVSGTASIVGHASIHAGDLGAQIDETFRNIDAIVERSTAERLIRPAPLDRDSIVKIYLRDTSKAATVARELRRRLSPSVPVLLLAADICRSDLLVEIELAHQG